MGMLLVIYSDTTVDKTGYSVSVHKCCYLTKLYLIVWQLFEGSIIKYGICSFVEIC